MGLRPICPLKNVKLLLISIDLRVCFSLFRGSVTCFIDTLFFLDTFWGVLLSNTLLMPFVLTSPLGARDSALAA